MSVEWRCLSACYLLTLLTLGCQQRPGPPPNVIVLSLDTVRSDAVSSLPDGTRLPSLGLFAADAVTFRNAYSNMPFTLPAHMSLFTGHHHAVHGVVNDKSVLAPGLSTLAERFQEVGYATSGLYTTEWLQPEFGFGRGFDSYDKIPHGPRYARRLIQQTLSQIDDDLGQRQPFFLFLHLFDAHSDFRYQSKSRLPYFSPAEYRRDLPENLERRFCDPETRCATSYLVAADRENWELSAEDTELLKELYLRGIACLDADLETLITGLKQRQLYDDTLIIVLSDHGEEFREHGRLIHSQVYEETVGIPLLVKLPGNTGAGTQVDELTTLTDVFSMLAQIAGPEPPVSDKDALKMLRQHSRPTVLFQDKLKRSTWALRSGPWKLIRDLDTDRVELYRVVDDPAELEDLAESDRETVARLSGLMDRELQLLDGEATRLATRQVGSETVLDPEERKRLEALGYVD